MKTSCRSSLSIFWFVLYHVYLAVGLASLMQVRDIELSIIMSPDGLINTKGTTGASGRDNVKIHSYEFSPHSFLLSVLLNLPPCIYSVVVTNRGYLCAKNVRFV